MLNIKSLIYPAPPTSYSEGTFFGELIYVPRLYHPEPRPDGIELIKETIDQNMPCLYLPYLNGGSSKILIYFHANAEDLGHCYDMLDKIR